MKILVTAAILWACLVTLVVMMLIADADAQCVATGPQPPPFVTDAASQGQASNYIDYLLGQVGGTTVGSANQFALVLQGGVNGPTNSLSQYEDAGLLIQMATADPSQYGPDITRDMVGIDGRGMIIAGNETGRAWGGYFEGRAQPGADGQLIGIEVNAVGGNAQPGIAQTNSKYNIVLDSTTQLGVIASAGIWFNSTGANPGWQTGIYGSAPTIAAGGDFLRYDASNGGGGPLVHITQIGNVGGPGEQHEHSCEIADNHEVGYQCAWFIGNGGIPLSPIELSNIDISYDGECVTYPTIAAKDMVTGATSAGVAAQTSMASGGTPLSVTAGDLVRAVMLQGPTGCNGSGHFHVTFHYHYQ